MDTVDDEPDGIVGEPSDLKLLFSEQWRDLLENYILKELNSIDQKQLYSSFKDAREAIKRSGIKLIKGFKIEDLTSLSQLEIAWVHRANSMSQKAFCREVARMNKLEYLVWAREVKNCDWDYWTISAAAEKGDLAMVKYCVENGCPMDEVACEFAAREGHLDVLKYLHENDCPWISLACSWAHEYNHIDCLNYLIEQKCPGWERYV
jgi:hypothetical protein